MTLRINGVCGLLLLGLAVGCGSRPTSTAPTELTIDPSLSDGIAKYTRVEGAECLIPQVVSGQPNAFDLEVARHRWLAENYPGFRVKREYHVLTLAPEHGEPTEATDTSNSGCAVEFETADGHLIDECFVKGLQTTVDGDT